MLELLVGAILIWAIITALGHASWVVTAALIRVVFASSTGSARSTGSPPPNPATKPGSVSGSDLRSFDRVLRHLVARERLSASEAAALRDYLRDREQAAVERDRPRVGESATPGPGRRTSKSASPQATCPGTGGTPPARQPSGTPFSPAGSRPSRADTRDFGVRAPGDGGSSDPSPGAATKSLRGPVASDSTSTQSAASNRLTSAGKSTAEVVQSFLAEHNIRWGELVAGILIVVCSIGLVVSLWNTLTRTVLPSLIFLGGNAAIFAAGLYTLSRWKLRSTSRAVLVIATLLVPLSILAGLAASGTHADRVRLTDAATVASILAASAVYASLLWIGGRALVGSKRARIFAPAIAGPAAVLPLMPAAVRQLGADAGWVTAAGMVVMAVAFAAETGWRRHPGRSVGKIEGRTRLLTLALAVFSATVMSAYAAFLIDDASLQSTLPLAIAAIPALIAVAGVGGDLALNSRAAIQAMLGTISAVIGLAIVVVILPATMVDDAWVWAWGVTATVSGFVIGMRQRRPRWLALAAVPIGVSVVVTSPVWMGSVGWLEIPLWRRFVRGEPMMAAAMVAAVAGLASVLDRDRERRKAFLAVGGGWASVAVAIAAILCVAPAEWFGDVPMWCSTAVFTLALTACVARSLGDSRWAPAAAVLLGLVSWSTIRPLELTIPVSVAGAERWSLVGASVAFGLLALGSLVRRSVKLDVSRPRSVVRSSRLWTNVAFVAAVLSAVASLIDAYAAWERAAIALSAATLLTLWVALDRRSLHRLRITQVVSATVFVVVAVRSGWSGSFLAADSWDAGLAPWLWCGVVSVIPLPWFLLRVSSNVGPAWYRRRLRLLHSRQFSPLRMPEGVAVASAAGFLLGIGGLRFAKPIAELLSYDTFAVSPGNVVALCVCGLVLLSVHGLRRLSPSTEQYSGRLETVAYVAVALWLCAAASSLALHAPEARLVAATTTLLIALGFTEFWLRRKLVGEERKFASGVVVAAGAAVLLTSSTVLLKVGFVPYVLAGSPTQPLESLAVAAWWFAIGIGLLVAARRRPSESFEAASALFVPLAAVVAVFPAVHVRAEVAIQIAAIVSFAWLPLRRLMLGHSSGSPGLGGIIRIARFRGLEELGVRHVDGAWSWAAAGSRRFVQLVGFGTAITVIAGLMLDAFPLDPWFGPVGALASVLAVGTRPQLATPWVLFTVLAGQLAWAGALIFGLPLDAAPETLLIIWCIAACGSLARYRILGAPADFAHGALVVPVLMIASRLLDTTTTSVMTGVGVAAAVTGGLFVTAAGLAQSPGQRVTSLARWLGRFVLVGGGFLLADRLSGGNFDSVSWTTWICWFGGWIAVWRVSSPDRGSLRSDGRDADPLMSGPLPDTEAALVVMGMILVEAWSVVQSGMGLIPVSSFSDPLLAVRSAAALVAVATTFLRADRNAVWSIALFTLLGITVCVSVSAAAAVDATPAQRWATASISSGVVLAWLAQLIPRLSRFAASRAAPVGQGRGVRPRRLIRAGWQGAAVLGAVSALASIAMMAERDSMATIHLTICGVALSALTLLELAELGRSGRLRDAAIGVGLAAVGLWASVGGQESIAPWLARSMRWLVASTVMIPTLGFLLPRLLGEALAARWRDALWRGCLASGVAACGSLAAMLAMEALTRNPSDGLPGVADSLVLGVAFTLAILSGVAALSAVLSWRGERPNGISSSMVLIKASAAQRRLLIVAAQAGAAVTWLHIFLCRPQWAFVGVREFWPYVVMLLSFISVGITEWARRRGDPLMSDTLRQTSLYLPLIPVIGFWLSSSDAIRDWSFAGDEVPYSLLLAVGAGYYAGLAALWRGWVPRVGSVVLGNAALWVILVQSPGWGFLAHPQAWMIPPAVCVLAVSHGYRDRLGPRLVSAVRYGATLVIYVSSTADMLIADIGESLSGPIVLVSLALAGTLAGVILRVKPFLYVGSTFVFIGVTSMVWHAQRAIDQTWPWWAFGITMGLLLLGGLMAIEKNRPQLRRYVHKLEAWEP